MGSWKGRNRTPASKVEGESVTTLPPWPPSKVGIYPQAIMYKLQAYHEIYYIK